MDICIRIPLFAIAPALISVWPFKCNKGGWSSFWTGVSETLKNKEKIAKSALAFAQCWKTLLEMSVQKIRKQKRDGCLTMLEGRHWFLVVGALVLEHIVS